MVSLALASYYLAVALFFECRFDEASFRMGQSLKITMAAHNLWGVSAMKSNQSLFQSWRGQVGLGFQTSNEALKVAEQSGDIYSRMIAQLCHGVACYALGAFDEAIESLTKGLALGESNTHVTVVAMALTAIAESYLETGNYEAAEDYFRKSVELYQNSGLLPSLANVNRMALAKAMLLSSAKTTDLEKLYTYARNNRIKTYEGWMRRYLAEILLIMDDHHTSEAQHWIEEAIEADKRNQMMFPLGRDHAVYAELFKRKGDKDKAKEQLVRAIDIYKECGADGWVTKAEEELARLQ